MAQFKRRGEESLPTDMELVTQSLGRVEVTVNRLERLLVPLLQIEAEALSGIIEQIMSEPKKEEPEQQNEYSPRSTVEVPYGTISVPIEPDTPKVESYIPRTRTKIYRRSKITSSKLGREICEILKDKGPMTKTDLWKEVKYGWPVFNKALDYLQNKDRLQGGVHKGETIQIKSLVTPTIPIQINGPIHTDKDSFKKEICKFISEKGICTPSNVLKNVKLTGPRWDEGLGLLEELVSEGKLKEKQMSPSRFKYSIPGEYESVRKVFPRDSYAQSGVKIPAQPPKPEYDWKEPRIQSFLFNEAQKMLSYTLKVPLMAESAPIQFKAYLEDVRVRFKQAFPHARNPKRFYEDDFDFHLMDEFAIYATEKCVGTKSRGRKITQKDMPYILTHVFGIDCSVFKGILGV